MRRNIFLIGIASTISFLGFNTAVHAGAVTSKEEISIKTTGGGIKIKSDNGNSFAIGGRIMYDYDYYDGAYNADNDGDSGSESEFRRTRINVKGTSGKNWAYKMTVDIDEGEAEIDTGYIKYQGFENVDLLLGRFKAPVGLEELTSSKWISTIERSVISSDLGVLSGKPDFQFAAHAHFDPVFLQAAIIDEGNEDVDTQDTYSIALRAGGAFGLFEEADESFIHGAISYATRDLGDQGTVGFETEGGVHALAGDIKVQDDADFETDDADQIGVEGAFVYGPWSVQGEYYDVSFDGDTNGAGDISDTDIDVSAFYILGSWFITGESRASNYKSKVGKFDKIKPEGTNGAWEVVAKYEDGEVDPDNQNSESEYELLTLGVNWYATNNVKFMLNYLDIDTDNWDSEDGVPLSTIGEEDGNAVSFRAQYAF